MVRCQIMRGTVQVRDPGAMSPLHSYALQAIAVHDDLKEVLNSFGVGRRVMQDVLVDLFYSGLVYLDVHQGRVVASPEVMTAIETGRLGEALVKEKLLEIEVTWVQELVSGEVMVYPLVSRFLDRPATSGRFRNIVSGPSSITPLDNLSTRALAKAALPILKERAPPADTVLDRVERITNRKMVGSRTFYVPLRLVRPSSDRPAITIPDIVGVPERIIDAWTVALNPADDPVTLSVVRGRELDEQLPPRADVLGDLWSSSVGKLRAIASTPRWTDASLNEADHALATLASIGERADGLTATTASRSVVVGSHQLHFDRLVPALAAAKSTVVIGSAFASEGAVLALAKSLLPSFRHGVKVLLLCGLPNIPPGSSRVDDGEKVQTQLNKIAPQDPGDDLPPISFLHSILPSHSKFVLIDGREVWVSSLNWLSAHPTSHAWEATFVGEGPGLVAEVRSSVTPYLPRDHAFRAVLESRGSGDEAMLPGPAERPWSRAAGALDSVWRSHLVEYDVTGKQPPRSPLEDAVMECAKVGENLRNAGTAAVVLDSDHRRILTNAIATAKKEVILTSDGLTAEGAGPVLSGLLSEAANRGVKILVRWGRKDPDDGVQGVGLHASQRAAELRTEVGPGLDINQTPAGVHGKVLIVDRTFAVITSFNFLSFGGVPGRERTLSGEMGVAVTDPDACRAISDSLLGLESGKHRVSSWR